MKNEIKNFSSADEFIKSQLEFIDDYTSGRLTYRDEKGELKFKRNFTKTEKEIRKIILAVVNSKVMNFQVKSKVVIELTKIYNENMKTQKTIKQEVKECVIEMRNIIIEKGKDAWYDVVTKKSVELANRKSKKDNRLIFIEIRSVIYQIYKLVNNDLSNFDEIYYSYNVFDF